MLVQAGLTNESGRVPVTDEEMALFAGSGYDRYREKWANMKDPRRLKISWNWAALTGLLWLGYRKMYAYMFILAAVILAAGLFLPGQSASLDSYGGVMIFTALMANWLYSQHARLKIARIKRKVGDADRQKEAIERAGGTSWAGAALALILLLVVAVFPWTVKAMLNSYSMIFCEDVNQKANLEPIRPGTVFRPGQVVVRLSTGASFGTDSLKAVSYRVSGGKETVYAWRDCQVQPDWNVVAVLLEFADPGPYRVEFVRADGTRIASGRVEIRP